MNEGLDKQFNRWELGKFVVPTILMMVFMSVYTIVDGIFVARLVGSHALSAINITLPITNLIYGIAIMFATGGCAIVAKNLGEGLEDKARGRFSFIVCVVIGIGIVFSIVGITFLEPINKALGASELIMGYANDYLKVILLFIPITMVKVLFDYFIIVAGKPNLGFALGLIGGIINMVLDYIFIGPMGMGIAGAALATGIGQLIPVCIALVFFVQKKHSIYFTKPKGSVDVLVRSMMNGSSEMVTNLAGGITTFLFNMVMMKHVGEDGVAAVTVVLYAQFLLTAGYLGFTSGVSPIISFKYGNGDTVQLKKIVTYCYQFVAGASVCTFLLSYFIAPFVVGTFVNPDTLVYELAVKGFYLFAIGFLFTGVNIFTSGMFTAFSNGKVSAIISFLRTFVFVVCMILTLPMILGVNGVWLAVPLAEMMALGVSLYYITKYSGVYGYKEKQV